MKKIYTVIAMALLGISSMSAQTMTLKIEGKEVKNGDDIVIHKAPKETKVGPMTMYDLGVEVEFKSNIAQTVETEGIDLDQVAPGLACCPTGFTCTTAGANNGWVSTGSMTNLTAGREVNGEWIHYNYQKTKPADGTVRKSKITLKGASETIVFTLTIDTDTTVDFLAGDANNDGKVSVADIVATANHILGNTPADFNTKNADSNEDGEITVSDIVKDAQLILGSK